VTRSVYAAHLLAAALQGRRAVSIRSAGLNTEPGWRAHPRVIARCQALNIDPVGHLSVQVTQMMVRTADIVLVMDVSQLMAVSRRFPRARRKTFLFACLSPEVPMEIGDPVGKDNAAVDACLDHIERALKPVIEIMTDCDTATACRA